MWSRPIGVNRHFRRWQAATAVTLLLCLAGAVLAAWLVVPRPFAHGWRTGQQEWTLEMTEAPACSQRLPELCAQDLPGRQPLYASLWRYTWTQGGQHVTGQRLFTLRITP